jgi:hypothetical protein
MLGARMIRQEKLEKSDRWRTDALVQILRSMIWQFNDFI